MVGRVSVQRPLWLLHSAAPGDQGILWSGSCPMICRPRSPAARDLVLRRSPVAVVLLPHGHCSPSSAASAWCGVSLLSTTARRETVRFVRLTPARRASGIGNWDQPRPTTCRGRPLSENPTYSAFWSGFGVPCLSLQRLALSVGSGRTARLAPRKNLPYSGVRPEPGFGCWPRPRGGGPSKRKS